MAQQVRIRTATGWQDLVGATGPAGKPGNTAVSAWYNWVADPEFPPASGEVRGGEIPPVGQTGILAISQVDGEGKNCEFFEVFPGQILLIRDGNAGLHELIATDREALLSTPSNYAAIGYQVVTTDGSSVHGQLVEVTLYEALPGDPVSGPPGPQGPPGPPGSGSGSGDISYVHTQVPLSAVWVVVHNLGKYPSVTVVDSGGTEVLTDLHYDSFNQVTLTFGAPSSGKAYVN